MLAVILAIQFEQVERIQEHLRVMGIGMQLVEVRRAVLSSPNRFPSTMMDLTIRAAMDAATSPEYDVDNQQ